jgi:hypothetical protein
MACSSLYISTVHLIDIAIAPRCSCEAAQEISMEELAELIPIKSGMILTMVLRSWIS